jgi:hypothetical protein
MKRLPLRTIDFDNQRRARYLLPRRFDDIERIPLTLGYRQVPVAVVLGSVFGLADEQAGACIRIFERLLLPQVARMGGVVVSPALQGGIAHLLGQAARARGRRDVPLIGLDLAADAYYPGSPTDDEAAVDLEPNHTDFVLVPGGDRRVLPTWRTYLASALAAAASEEGGVGQGRPSVTLVFGGVAPGTWDEIAASVERRRPVLALLGLGEGADRIARMIAGRTLPDTHPALSQALGSGLLSSIPLAETGALAEALRRALPD